MARLLVHVEGETEEEFVNTMLAPHLYGVGYSYVSARLLGNSRIRQRRGGIKGWDSVSKDIVNHLNQDRSSISTTMVDYYGLPTSGNKAWPGRVIAATESFAQKATTVEAALSADIQFKMGARFDANRFVPFVTMHEFEGLLFSDCNKFASGIGRFDLAPKFQGIRDDFATPEEINDSPTTAPSKRVSDLVLGYEKPLLGVLAALEIGLDRIRDECPHFDQWIVRLEALS